MKYKMKTSLSSRIFDFLNVILMAFIVICMIYPVLHVVAVSFSSPPYIELGMISVYPRGFNLGGYTYILSNISVWRAYGMTILYAFIRTIFTLAFTSAVAYALSTEGFILHKPLVIFFTVTMFFNGGLIPTYLVISSLGLADTILVMTIPGAVSAFNIIIFRTFFKGLPPELRESARIDGANDVRILFSIILPLSTPVLATIALFTIVGVWNDWFQAFIYLSEQWRMPLQIILKRMVVNEDLFSIGGAAAATKTLMTKFEIHPQNIQMAAIVVALIPIYLVYPFLQKYFTKGMLLGSIKG